MQREERVRLGNHVGYYTAQRRVEGRSCKRLGRQQEKGWERKRRRGVEEKVFDFLTD